MVRRARVVAFVQSILIFLLLVAMAVEYDHNEFFQAWVKARLGGFGFVLNGTLAAFYAGLMVAYYLNQPLPKPYRKQVRIDDEIYAGRRPVEREEPVP